jgi:hypothetical protein
MNHGVIIQDLNFDVDNIYATVSTYFNNPTMHKIKNIENFSMYISKVKCLLSTFNRYIIVFVNQDDFPPNYKEKLSELKWVNLQTRTLTDNHNIPEHEYNPTRNTPLYTSIYRTSKDINNSKYACDKLPVEITLLHDKNGANQYQDKGFVVTALETYNTILSIKND